MITKEKTLISLDRYLFVNQLLIGLYVLSFFFVGIDMPPQVSDSHGFIIAVFGWAGIIQMQFAWFANPLLVISFISAQSGKFKRSAIFALLAAALSINSITLFTQGVMINVVPTFRKADGFGIGGYIWFAAIFATLVWSLCAYFKFGPKIVIPEDP